MGSCRTQEIACGVSAIPLFVLLVGIPMVPRERDSASGLRGCLGLWQDGVECLAGASQSAAQPENFL